MDINKQNSRINLERMSAYDNCARRIEPLTIIRFLLCVCVVLVLDVMWVCFQNDFYFNLFLFYCFFASLLWKVLDFIIAKEKLKTARFFQLFECDLFGTRWNNYLCGVKPLPEEVFFNMSSSIEQYQNRYTDKLYGLSNETVTLSCFRMDVIYHAHLLEKHLRLCVWILMFSVLVVLGCSLLVDLNLRGTLLFFFAPSVPLGIWFCSIWDKYHHSQEQIVTIKMMIDDSVEKGFSSEHNNMIQDYLFIFNRDLYAIPVFLFKRRRLKLYEMMEKERIANDMKEKVEE